MAISCGLLVYREGAHGTEVLLVHPGGPYFRNKDAGSWTVPKGLVEPNEDLLDAARREFEEETSLRAPEGGYRSLSHVRQKGGKAVYVWAVRGDYDAAAVRSNTTTIEWPPRSGRRCTIPEIDQAAWFPVEEARAKLLAAQTRFLDRLMAPAKPAQGRW